MSKSTEMEVFLDEVSEMLFGNSRSAAIDAGFCVMCSGDAKEFRNAQSRREFQISGMCQKCQDDLFGID